MLKKRLTALVCASTMTMGVTVFSTNAADVLKGDANCDGNVNLADAVKIQQYLANSEKYPLTEQGIKNADIDGNEGITALDALEIQKMDAINATGNLNYDSGNIIINSEETKNPLAFNKLLLFDDSNGITGKAAYEGTNQLSITASAIGDKIDNVQIELGSRHKEKDGTITKSPIVETEVFAINGMSKELSMAVKYEDNYYKISNWRNYGNGRELTLGEFIEDSGIKAYTFDCDNAHYVAEDVSETLENSEECIKTVYQWFEKYSDNPCYVVRDTALPSQIGKVDTSNYITYGFDNIGINTRFSVRLYSEGYIEIIYNDYFSVWFVSDEAINR